MASPSPQKSPVDTATSGGSRKSNLAPTPPNSYDHLIKLLLIGDSGTFSPH
jgi:hypothetical protein